MKAAQGETQVFAELPWVVIQDYDCPLAGLKYDEDAHIYLPTKKNIGEVKRLLLALVGKLILIGLIAFFLIGLVTSIRWMLR